MGISPRLLRPKATGLDPRSIPGLVLWLDAADGSTLFQDSAATTPANATNDPVGAWLDKSGNGRHATQATAASRPTVSGTALNGRRQLSLVSQHLRGPLVPLTTWTGSASIYWVGRTGHASFAAIVFNDGSTGDQGNAFHAGWLNAQGVGAYGNGWDAGNSPRAESPLAWRSANVVAGVTLSSTEAVARVNGATTNTVASLTGTLSQAAPTQFYVGRDNDGTWTNLNGSLAELLIYQPALTASQRVLLERYLASKWGIALAPQVSNADAQDWINRVYLAGGQVTPSCASAVDAFCTAIENAGIRSKFYRLNLFCGTGLTSCLVPLYRGPSLGGTQYGSATDVNSGGLFVSADYTETGSAAGGLKGSSNKYLDTGFDYAVLPSVASRHIAVYETLKSPNTFDASIGHSANSSVDGFVLGTFAASSDYALWRAGGFGGQGAVLASSSGYSNGGFWIGQNTSLRATQLYKNGIQSATGSADSDMAALGGTVAVFAWKITGGVPDPTLVYYSAARLGGYSIGTSFTAGEALAYHNAMQSFQTALSRNAQ